MCDKPLSSVTRGLAETTFFDALRHPPPRSLETRSLQRNIKNTQVARDSSQKITDHLNSLLFFRTGTRPVDRVNPGGSTRGSSAISSVDTASWPKALGLFGTWATSDPVEGGPAKTGGGRPEIVGLEDLSEAVLSLVMDVYGNSTDPLVSPAL